MPKAGPMHRIAVLLLAVLFCVSAPGQVPQNLPLPRPVAPQPASPPPATPNITHEMTAADLEAFFDGLLPLQIQQNDIQGAVVCVVRNGQVLFAKGYGYADSDRKKPVSPETTLFRVGSISKLFTWTAVMQLVEQGKLELDRDVNDYIDFKIPLAYGKPVTLRHLMTHTSGFDETIKDLIQDDPKAMMPLQEYMRSHLPKRIFPSGMIPAYSNYGAGLAGYIVQRVSGQPFERYIDDSVIKPLGMTHASFRQPLPDNLQEEVSDGFKLASDGAKSFEYVQPAPAGAMAASAVDIAHFMIAHLQDGEYNGARVLLASTAQLMHSRQFGLDPNMNGMALGFYEESRNGHRIIGHGGDTIYFHSDLHLIPDANVGLFVSYNSAGRGDTSPRTPLWRHFLDRYFPYTPPDAPKLSNPGRDAKDVAGTYITSRRFQNSILRVLSLAEEQSVTGKPDGTITVDNMKGLNGKVKQWRDLGNNMFRDTNDNQSRLLFKPDINGRMEMITDFPAIVYEHVHWWKSKNIMAILLASVLGIFLFTLIAWPVGTLIRTHYGLSMPIAGIASGTRLIIRVVCLIDTAVLALWIGFLIYGSEHLSAFSSRSDEFIHTVQIMAMVGCAGAVAALVHGIVAWFNAQYSRWGKVLETVIVLACFAWVWLMLAWNVLHWDLHY